MIKNLNVWAKSEMKHNKRLMYTENFLVDDLSVLGWALFDSAIPDGLTSHIHHQDYEICYVVQGQINWWVNNDVYKVKRGDFFITKPGEQHGGVNGVMERCEIYWLQLSLNDIEPEVRQNKRSETQHLVSSLDQIKHRAFPAIFDMKFAFHRLIAEQENPGEFASSLSRATLHEILICLIRSHKNFNSDYRGRSKTPSLEIQNALLWIENHLTENFMVADIAATVNMSTNYFQKRFLHEIGHPPAEYCNRKRVEKAEALLETSSDSISDIALSLGFSSSQYFSTVFKKFKGITPRAHRKQHRSFSHSVGGAAHIDNA